jgi:hypothetical protein
MKGATFVCQDKECCMEITITDPQKGLQRMLTVARYGSKMVEFQTIARRKNTDLTQVHIVTIELLRALQVVFPELQIRFNDPSESN